jgi:hypothetical protein
MFQRDSFFLYPISVIKIIILFFIPIVPVWYPIGFLTYRSDIQYSDSPIAQIKYGLIV